MCRSRHWLLPFLFWILPACLLVHSVDEEENLVDDVDECESRDDPIELDYIDQTWNMSRVRCKEKADCGDERRSRMLLTVMMRILEFGRRRSARCCWWWRWCCEKSRSRGRFGILVHCCQNLTSPATQWRSALLCSEISLFREGLGPRPRRGSLSRSSPLPSD